MKEELRTLACGAALAAAIALTIAGCGGKQTMASKSAAAYDEARKKGIPISAGEHGGHGTEASAETPATTSTSTAAAMPGMNHGQMAGMDHSSMPGMKHGAAPGATHDMSGMAHESMAGMDHSKMPGMQHDKSSAAMHDMSGMTHGSMAGMDHSKMPGMQHGAAAGATHDMSGMAHGSMAGMQHGAPAAAIEPAPPTTNAAIAQTQPAATLRSDDFDAPAPTAVGEAAKTGAQQHPTPQPPHQHHDGGDA